MKLLKNNFKLIIGFIAGLILASSVVVYATINAGDVTYTKQGGNVTTVSVALNELYANKRDTTNEVKNITVNGSQTLDKYYKNINVNVPIGFTKTLLSSGLSSRTTQTVSASSIPNYQDLTEDNFILEIVEIIYVGYGNTGETTRIAEISKSYNKNTGQLSLGIQRAVQNMGDGKYVCMHNTYNVYCIY